MKKLFVLISLLGLMSVTHAQNVQESSIKFVIKNAGVKVRGSLELDKFEAKFDANNLQSSEIYATAIVSSINTKNKKRDAHLNRSDFFDAETYPRITMKSNYFVPKGNDQYEASFDVTVKGVTKEILVDMIVLEENGKQDFSVTFSMNRLDFKVGKKNPIMAKRVDVSASVIIGDN